MTRKTSGGGKRLAMLKHARDTSNGMFKVDIPDLIENLGIFFTMRGIGSALYDLIGNLELVRERVEQIDNVYFRCYDLLYDLLKECGGSSSCNCFRIMGRGRVAKIQSATCPPCCRLHSSGSLPCPY